MQVQAHATSPDPVAADKHRLNGRLPAFDYQPRTRVMFGPGKIGDLGKLATELGASRVLLVTDRGLEDAGHPRKGIAALESAGLSVAIFDDVQPNPTTDDVDRGLAIARDWGIDLIVGLGGGSSMDCAKGINFLLTNGGRIEDYWGANKATRPHAADVRRSDDFRDGQRSPIVCTDCEPENAHENGVWRSESRLPDCRVGS